MKPPRPAWLPNRLLTMKEVATLLQISPRQVHRLTVKKQLATVRLGRSVRIRPEAITILLEEQK